MMGIIITTLQGAAYELNQIRLNNMKPLVHNLVVPSMYSMNMNCHYLSFPNSFHGLYLFTHVLLFPFLSQTLSILSPYLNSTSSPLNLSDYNKVIYSLLCFYIPLLVLLRCPIKFSLQTYRMPDTKVILQILIWKNTSEGEIQRFSIIFFSISAE